MWVYHFDYLIFLSLKVMQYHSGPLLSLTNKDQTPQLSKSKLYLPHNDNNSSQGLIRSQNSGSRLSLKISILHFKLRRSGKAILVLAFANLEICWAFYSTKFIYFLFILLNFILVFYNVFCCNILISISELFLFWSEEVVCSCFVL